MRTKLFVLLIGLLMIAGTMAAGSLANYQLAVLTLGPNTQSATSSNYVLAEVTGQSSIGRAASAAYTACYGVRCVITAIPPAIVPGHRFLYLPVLANQYDVNADPYEPDATRLQAKSLPSDGSVQLHNFYPADDVDWLRLEVGPGTYLVATSVAANLYPDTIMALYAGNGLTQLALNDDCTGFTRASCLTYTSSLSTTLYLKLWPYDATSIGPDSWYGLSVVKQ
jgi:hypothetical protein